MPNTDDFRRALRGIFQEAARAGHTRVRVQAGELHRTVGGYPGANHRMPLCCSVMRSGMRTGDEIIEQLESGQGARLTIVYRLPRPAVVVSSVSDAAGEKLGPASDTDSPLVDTPSGGARAARGVVQPRDGFHAGVDIRVLVISSCTEQKAVDSPDKLTLADFADRTRLATRETTLRSLARPAAEMYTGQQHVLLMRGVRQLRTQYGADAVKVQIVSAGYGLVDENRLIVPYEATFKGMRRQKALAWAAHLGVARAIRDAISGWRFVIVMLGEDYLRVIEPPVRAGSNQRLIFLAKPAWAGRLGEAVGVPAGINEATEFGAGLVALKGRMFELFASALIREPSLLDAVLLDSSNATFLSALRTTGRSI